MPTVTREYATVSTINQNRSASQYRASSIAKICKGAFLSLHFGCGLSLLLPKPSGRSIRRPTNALKACKDIGEQRFIADQRETTLSQ